jgi:aminopeptidase-like protein
MLKAKPNGVGEEMISWARDLYPIKRSITGPGLRMTLNYLKSLLPDLNVCAIDSGEKVFDWTIPDEWTLREAYIQDKNGKKIVDVESHGLHVVGYSHAIDIEMDLENLQKHLHSLPDQPNAIPYITSYYNRTWGFCISENDRQKLQPGMYRIKIDADLKPGVLNYADLVLPGQSEKEIVFSTYICHPMMANNELSGPVVTTALARWLQKRDRRYTYRFIFIPETIGSITYIKRNLKHLKDKTHAGFVVTCIGDERAYSFLPSRNGETIADRTALYILRRYIPEFNSYSFLERGSDERQYCSPLVDLPFVSIMRSKYGTYPEYHTSLDDFSLVTARGLEGGLAALQATVDALEKNYTYKNVFQCEPQLSKHGLYPSMSSKNSGLTVRNMMNLLTYTDGKTDLLAVSEKINITIDEAATIAERMVECGVLKRT